MSEGSVPGSPDSLSSSQSCSPPRTPPNLHQNTVDPAARWLVQKFGGTSVGKFAVKIARDIVSNYIDQHKVAIVCSARSGTTKALGTTNLLLKSASQTLQGRRKSLSNGRSGATTPVTKGLFGVGCDGSHSPPLSPQQRGRVTPPSSFTALTPLATPLAGHTPPEFNATVDIIRDEHVIAAKASVRDPEILDELLQEIEADCDWLRNFLFAAQIIDEISPRSQDSIVGLGERLACKIMTAVLRDQGIDAEYVSLEDIVPISEDSDAQEDGTLDQDFYDRLATALGERIAQCGSRVPVVTGFFGPVPGSLLSQVGRGYTDLCSALLAVGLDAAELQIWKEVDGIFTADPRKVPTARLLSIITPDEAAELTYYGSEVVHPFTMEQAIRRKIPIRIKNVENPKGGGTVIYPDADVETSEEQDLHVGDERVPLATLQRMDFMADEQKRKRLPTAVTIKEHIIVLNVNSNRKSVSHGFLAGIFGTLDQYGVVVDLISTSEVHVSMAIESGLAKKVLDRLIKELKKSGTVSMHRDMAILSLVGKEMRNMVGIAGKMFTTLAQGNVNIEMISQGASEINISCVIEAKDSVKALNLIHQGCLQITPDGVMGRIGPWLF
ncbi:putative aspartate kinase [Lyophyllum shimeji]|uniref:aspartate kinase n=1 Tax=Lyophyllum shimeji TaxID=47721 RepID=A0A9P3PML3_LYOSH|nr:putative aspartate kinase [Lyophyllum shimeji]